MTADVIHDLVGRKDFWTRITSLGQFWLVDRSFGGFWKFLDGNLFMVIPCTKHTKSTKWHAFSDWSIILDSRKNSDSSPWIWETKTMSRTKLGILLCRFQGQIKTDEVARSFLIDDWWKQNVWNIWLSPDFLWIFYISLCMTSPMSNQLESQKTIVNQKWIRNPSQSFLFRIAKIYPAPTSTKKYHIFPDLIALHHAKCLDYTQPW